MACVIACFRVMFPTSGGVEVDGEKEIDLVDEVYCSPVVDGKVVEEQLINRNGALNKVNDL